MKHNDASPAVRCIAPKKIALVVVRVEMVNVRAKKGTRRCPF